ncbi:MAG: histidine kinase [Massilia sp.]|nr:histidine kinase [Massilia sp.]MDB5793254.1 histidine kinase [Massilia sp.]
MKLTSDQQSRPRALSLISQRMTELREVVLDEWERRVRAEIAGAAGLKHPVLINTFPVLYDNLVEALTPDYPRTSAAVATPSVALEHGGERARLTCYEAKSIIIEYQLMRETILDVLRGHAVPVSEHESQIISSAIDASIREAVTAFALAQVELRERFFGAIAHDLRGPLSNAVLFAGLIGQTADLSKIHGYAEKIRDNLGRVDQMIRQLLDTLLFQHGERLPIKPADLDMADIVAEVCDEMMLVHGPRFDVQGGTVRGWWDRAELQRALENLIGNALKYGLPDTPIRIVYRSDHGRAYLSVHNEGEPIPPDQLESVFQVFRRAMAAKQGDSQGWGIGLPYVRSVAESHGGSIDVDSAPERGTTFTINIPLDARPFRDAPTL